MKVSYCMKFLILSKIWAHTKWFLTFSFLFLMRSTFFSVSLLASSLLFNPPTRSPWQAYILPTKFTPTAVLRQNDPLLWLCLPVSPVKVLNSYFITVTCLLQKSWMGCRQYLVENLRLSMFLILSNRLIGYFKITILGQLLL